MASFSLLHPQPLRLALVLALVCGGSASGQTNSWTGATSTALITSGNYAAGNSVAADGNATALFVFGREATNRTFLEASAEFKVNRILFEGATSFRLSNTGQFNFVGTGNGIIQSSSAAQTISGRIKVSNGPLTLSGNGAGLVTLSSAGISNDYGGTGLSKTGSSAFLLSSGNAITTGTVTISGGTLALGSRTSLTGLIQLRGGVLATSGTFSRALGPGTGDVNFAAGGGGFAAYGGALTVSTNVGIWAITTYALLNSTPLILGSSIADNVVTLSSVLSLGGAAREIRLVDNPNSANDRAVMSGVISGSGASGLTVTGSGSLTLSGTNTYTGVTTLSGGTLSVATIGNGGVAGNLGQASIAATRLVFDGGTLQYTGATAPTNRGFTLNAGKTGTIDVTTNTLTMSGASTATVGALTKAGAGNLTLSGANLHTGATTVSAGTLQIGAGGTTGSLSPSSAITNNSALAFNRSDTLTQGTNFGTISGTGTLTQAGSGSLVLSAANTYTGDTTVQAGTLVLGSTGSVASANYIVGGAGSSNATLDVTAKTGGLVIGNGQKLSGIGTVLGAVTLQGGSLMAPGNSAGTLTTGNLVFSGGVYAAEIASSVLADQLNVVGTARLDADTELLIELMNDYDPLKDDSWVLVNNDGIDAFATNGNHFTIAGAKLLDGKAFTFGGRNYKVDYNGGSGNDVVLTTLGAPAGSPTVVLDRAFVARIGTGLGAYSVYSTSVQAADGKIVVGGNFLAPSNYLARFNADGTPDTAFNANIGTGVNGAVRAISVQADGKIVVGGDFTAPRNYLARFNADGTPDTAFNTNIGTAVNGDVRALLIQAAGKIVVGGAFTTPSNRLARFNADGTPDTTFNTNTGTGLGGTVHGISVGGNNQIVVGGAFTSPSNYLARFSADGRPDTAFNASIGTRLNDIVWALSAQTNNQIVVGGTFTTPRNQLARFNSNGTPDTTFNTNLGTFAGVDVRATSIQADGKIVVGGAFTSPSNKLARFNTDGTPDTGFNAGIGTSLGAGVFATSVQADGTIVVGGAFTSPSNGLARFMPPCGPGIALSTSLWQQLSLPCAPAAGTTTMGAVFGSNTTGQLDPVNNPARWGLWQRNAANNGNVPMALTDTLGVGTGHWIKSLDAPVGGTLKLDDTLARPTPLTTGVTGCQSTEGCVVLPVASAAAATRMIANPFPHDVDWSKVRVRVAGASACGNTNPCTPAQAQTAGYLSSTVWVWNGNTYATWSDAAPTLGNLQYFKSFFVKVLPGGVGQTIDLLIPALGSTVETTSSAFFTQAEKASATLVAKASATRAAEPDERMATASVARKGIAAPVRLATATATPTRASSWLVDLGVLNTKTGWSAVVKLGQWAGAQAGYDAGDLGAMAPFGQPYLTAVLPHAEWAPGQAGDYTTDLRPATGFADKWNFEVRAAPLNSTVVLRWNASAAVLAKSRLIDRDTGAVIYPSDPRYADGYPMTLNTQVRRLTWEYMGN